MPRPLDQGEFNVVMNAFGPFERRPVIAVGVSGGADSTALAFLMGKWAQGAEGRIVGLVVDHGLRPESLREARQVARMLGSFGLDHHILRWRGEKPVSNIQAAARAARYDLLLGWCAKHAVLHLALAHHLDDQAETFLLRLGRGSGLEGLSCMASVHVRSDVRLLRPLLSISKARLIATLRAHGVGWLEDPSNRDPSHGRTRIRRAMPAMSVAGVEASRIAFAAQQLGRARGAIDLAVARLLAEAVVVHPAGFAEFDPTPLISTPEEVALRSLARMLQTVGGGGYTPRLARLKRLYSGLAGDFRRGATLGGCRIVPRRGRCLIVREVAGVPSIELKPGPRLLWDGRFEIALDRKEAAKHGKLSLGPLTESGWREVAGPETLTRTVTIPAPARASLPAIRDERGVLYVPHLAFRRGGDRALSLGMCRFAPRSELASGWFTVA